MLMFGPYYSDSILLIYRDMYMGYEHLSLEGKRFSIRRSRRTSSPRDSFPWGCTQSYKGVQQKGSGV